MNKKEELICKSEEKSVSLLTVLDKELEIENRRIHYGDSTQYEDFN